MYYPQFYFRLKNGKSFITSAKTFQEACWFLIGNNLLAKPEAGGAEAAEQLVRTSKRVLGALRVPLEHAYKDGTLEYCDKLKVVGLAGVDVNEACESGRNFQTEVSSSAKDPEWYPIGPAVETHEKAYYILTRCYKPDRQFRKSIFRIVKFTTCREVIAVDPFIKL